MYNEARTDPQFFFFFFPENWHLSVVGPLSTHFFVLLKNIFIYLFVAFYKYSYILFVNQKTKNNNNNNQAPKGFFR